MCSLGRERLDGGQVEQRTRAEERRTYFVTVFRNEILFFLQRENGRISDHERGGLVRLGVDRGPHIDIEALVARIVDAVSKSNAAG